MVGTSQPRCRRFESGRLHFFCSAGRMAVNSHEDDISISTQSLDGGRSHSRWSYANAEHAVAAYFHLACKMQGMPGLDPERMAVRVQSSPDQQNPHLEHIDELWALQEVFQEARRRAGRYRWRIWKRYRVDGLELREIEKVSKSHASRVTQKVDEAISDVLLEQGRLYRSYMSEDEYEAWIDQHY